jgi:hypothetical protein
MATKGSLLLRGDIPILSHITHDPTVFDTVNTGLSTIKTEMSDFHRLKGMGEYDVSVF